MYYACRHIVFLGFFLALIGLFQWGCKRDDQVVPPTVSTLEVTDIKADSAKCGGDIQDNGGAEILSKGLVWNTTSNPTKEQKLGYTSEGVGIGTFHSMITGLQANTTYFVRAYATNIGGTAYGEDVHFTTASGLNLPTLITSSVINIGPTEAQGGGDVIADAGSAVSVKGVCWSTSPNPTIVNNNTIDGSGLGSFTSSISGLPPNTTYFVRAYASNNSGIAYGNEVQFTTVAPTAPVVTTAPITNITPYGATSGGDIISDGGSTITAKGVCWSTNPNPSLADNVFNNGGGSASFVSVLSGLQYNVTYYLKAYATNSIGTGYGLEISFITAPTGSFPVYDIDGNGYDTVHIGTQVWLRPNLRTSRLQDGTPIPIVTAASAWPYIATPARCWYSNDSAAFDAFQGNLYNWYAVNTGILCPLGWHVPTLSEWMDLSNILGGIQNAGGALKETGTLHWNSPNTGATNSSGFTAVAGGQRRDFDGLFLQMGVYAIFWTTTVSNTWFSWNMVLQYQTTSLTNGSNMWETGASVRCLQD